MTRLYPLVVTKPKLATAVNALLAMFSLGILGASYMTWVQSGERSRNSFEVVQSAETLNFLDGWGGAAMANIWYCMPLLAATVIALVFVNRRRWATSAAVLLSAVVIVAAWKTMASLPTRSGPKVSLVLAVFLLFTALFAEHVDRSVTQTGTE